tara:strand:- start:1690 stop:2163 length:474 start_codon:yes stop_codon:yes gene_type:complete
MRQPKQKALAPLLSLQKLSRKSNSIASLIQLANSRQTLDDLLNQCLPDLLKGHFKVNSINEQTLILTCSSAKLMTRLRFIQDDILSKLSTLIAPNKVDMLQIKVRPNIQAKPEQTKPKAIPRHISKKNAQILLEEAEHTEDQNLKNILTSLAKHADQ